MPQIGVGARVTQIEFQKLSAAVTKNSSFRIVLSSFLLIGAPVYYFLSISDPDSKALFIFPQLAIAGYYLAKQLWNVNMHLARFCFATFSYVWFGLAPFVQLASGQLPILTPNVELSLLPIGALLTASCLTLTIFLIERRKETAYIAGEGQGQERIYVFPAMLLAIIGYATGFYYASSIGLRTLFQPRYQRNALSLESVGDPTFLALFQAIGWVPSLVACLALKSIHSATGKTRYWVLSIVASIPALILTNPISSARYLSGAVWGAIGITLFVSSRLKSFVRVKFAILFSIIFIFPAASIFRSATTQYSRQDFFSEYQGNPDYDAFFQFINSLEISRYHSWGWTDQLLGPLLFWVPRSVWADKPVDTGIYIANFKGYGFTNLSAPWLAEGIIGLGFFGLVVVTYLLARSIRKIDLGLSLDANGFVRPENAFLGFYLLIVLRGSILQCTGVLALFLALNFIMRRTSRSIRAN
jgi:hypothetical protein